MTNQFPSGLIQHKSFTQWRLRHSGSARVVDYALYCRTWACLLCILCHHPLHWLWLL